jgi:hypothetical protein
MTNENDLQYWIERRRWEKWARKKRQLEKQNQDQREDDSSGSIIGLDDNAADDR